ncbi:MAG: cytochrome c [Planctomycetaceae bacterium]
MRQLTYFSLILCLAGCSRIEPQFQNSQAIDNLRPEVQPAAEAVMQKYFGTPTQMNAWEKLPIRHSGAVGNVTEPIFNDADQVIGVQVDSTTLDQAWTITEGERLAWLEDKPVSAAGPLTVKSLTPAADSLHELMFSRPLEGSLPTVSEGAELRFVISPGELLISGRQLYAEHCLHCHGVSGDGAGPTAQYLNPLPRDYRQGKFKFTSTGGGMPPTRDDLANIITQGIPGTYMPSFKLLEEREKGAIVEYVRWLSMRGRSEIQLSEQTDFYSDASVDQRLDEVAATIPETDSRKKDLQTEQSKYEKAKEGLDPGSEQLAKLETSHRSARYALLSAEFDASLFKDLDDVLSEMVDATVGGLWREVEVPGEDGAPSPALVFPMTPRPEPTAESIAKGKELFLGAKGSCFNCHGPAGLGDGPQTRQVAEPKDGLIFSEPGLRDDWGHLIQPRNLRSGIFRGGRRPIDLYRRLSVGIKGTPMAGFSTLVRKADEGEAADDDGMTDADLWHLVNYVLSMPHEAVVAGEEISMPEIVTPPAATGETEAPVEAAPAEAAAVEAAATNS